MQDIHSIGVGGAGPQLYGGVCDSRRVRPNQQQASINCPRCDSPNTKFCYYNNYNLSQPRYYCKGCRRYWTKGGVLRNVPVGGGCRKGKRSVPKLSSNNVSTRIRKEVIVKSNSNSTTEITSTSAAVTVNPDIMPSNSNNSSSLNLPEFPELFKQQVVESTTKEEHIFKDVGSLANFMTSSISNDPNDINNMSIMYQKSNEQHKIEEKVELSGKNEGGLAPVDWENGDHGLFGIDTAYNYWSQLTQWGENNYSLDYLP